MRFRPANIRLINRRSNLPRLLLALSSTNGKSNNNDKNNPRRRAEVDRVTPYQSRISIGVPDQVFVRLDFPGKKSRLASLPMGTVVLILL
jgi:hypothetical protein